MCCLDGRDWCCFVTVLFWINIQRECDGDLKDSPVMFYNKGFPWEREHNRGGGGQITTKTRVSADTIDLGYLLYYVKTKDKSAQL